MARKVHKLRNFHPENFQVISIASHQSDYRLSWAMNEQLNLQFSKDDDLMAENKKGDSDLSFTKYTCSDVNHIQYHLIANKSEHGFLLTDMRNIDFLLKVSGDIDEDFIANMVREIKKIHIVITAFRLYPLKQKHKKQLTF